MQEQYDPMNDIKQVISNFFESYTLVAVAQHGLGSFATTELNGDQMVYDALEEFTFTKYAQNLTDKLCGDEQKISHQHRLEIYRTGTHLMEQTIEEYISKYGKQK